MELKIKYHNGNSFPIKGFFIKSSSPKVWLYEIENLGFDLKQIDVYVLPDVVANSVWGCLVVSKSQLTDTQIGKHELSQAVFSNFYIPEKSITSPLVLETDKEKLFGNGVTVYHPEIGFVECSEKFDFITVLNLPKENAVAVLSPEESAHIPFEIRSFEVKPVEDEDILQKLEEKTVPKKEKLPDEPLDKLEKAKLSFYKTLFNKKDNDKGKGSSDTSSIEKKGWLGKLDDFLQSATGGNSKAIEKMQQDFEDLEKRNQSQLDKLMDLFKDNPEEALKYAIPLDENGSSRGENNGLLDLSKRHNDFSLFGSNSSSNASGGGAVDIGDQYQRLRDQYHATARELKEKGEYEKAAFVYIKLLKDYYLAAATLEEGGLYQEAATIYIKHLNNKQKAAECYEKGRMISDAIDLYEELKQYEKVGDLYTALNKKQKANTFYKQTAEEYKKVQNYISASQIYEQKIGDFNESQLILLDSWREKSKDRITCLSTYFNNIPNANRLKKEIDLVYSKTVEENNAVDFLHVLKREYLKKNDLADHIKEISYQVISQQAKTNSSIIDHLRSFNLEDKEVTKDISRFKTNNKK